MVRNVPGDTPAPRPRSHRPCRRREFGQPEGREAGDPLPRSCRMIGVGEAEAAVRPAARALPAAERAAARSVV